VTVRHRIANEQAGQRLDRLLAELLTTGETAIEGMTRSQIKRALDQGAALVDGKPGRAGQRVRSGQELEFTPLPPEPLKVEPEKLPLEVVYEDDHVIVVNKAAGMVVHPSAGHRRGTLVAALLAHCQLAGGSEEELRPGVVHRLDRDTTGLMVVTKSAVAHEMLAQQFRVHSVGRRYLALVRGLPRPAAGTIDTSYGRHPNHRKKFSSRCDGSRRAITNYRTVETFATAAALVACELQTGRTHQVRVHLSDSGHPILGDPLYGGGHGGDRRLQPALRHLDRQALHATRLAFDAPGGAGHLEFETPPPQDFQEALAELRQLNGR
jgi:23S rRNA pseudouridine1911/1915/1917 synthase